MNSQPLINQTPAQRFREEPKNVHEHRDMVDSTRYQRAIDFGLLHYSLWLSQQVRDTNTAMAIGFKLQGAFEVIQAIRNLSETPTTKVLTPNDNLDHRA